ncbi:MAG: tetratricopeptide repeat protein [Dehalococcoidia bacterium]
MNKKDSKAKKYFLMGNALAALGRGEDALKAYDEALKIKPDFEGAWFNMGVALGNLGKYAEEIKCYNKAIKIDPNQAETWYNKGNALGNLGKYAEEIKCYNKSIKINPNDADAWNNKGIALGSLGKYTEEIKCYNKAIKINSNDAEVWNNKGTALGNLGKYTEAIKCFNKAIKINPNHADMWYNMGIALGNLRKYAKAIKCYNKAIKINPNHADAWYNKGNALDNLGKYAEVIKCYNKAIKINPNDAAAWNNKGIALKSLGKYAEAIKCYNKAIKINPNHAEAYGNLGTTLLDLREFSRAATNLRRAKELFSKRGEEKKAAKAHKYELLAKNASKLMSMLKHLDEQFTKCINSRSLTELKEKTLKVSEELQSIIDTFRKMRVPKDVKELLLSKDICLTALSSAVNFEEVDFEKLGNAKTVFDKWGLDTFVIAASSIDTFSRLLKKYKSLTEIPTDKEEYLLRGVLGASYILDGELTKEITSKITGEPFLMRAKGKEIGREPKIIYKYIGTTEKKWISLCLVQLNFSLDYRKPREQFGYFLMEKEKVKNKVFKALEIAKQNEVDVICFPELSFDKEWVKEIESAYKDMIIIGGSYYDKGYNVCPIIIDGAFVDPPYKKHKPSPIENPESTGYGMKSGNILYIFQTKCGRFSILTCMDYADQSYRICRYEEHGAKGVDFIINPCYDQNIFRFQNHCNSDCEDYGIDVIQVNRAPEDNKYGGTCIIGKEHETILERLKGDAFKPSDGVKYKLVQLDAEMIIIAKLNIEMKAPPVTIPIDYSGRIIVSKEKCYKYNGTLWSSLSRRTRS